MERSTRCLRLNEAGNEVYQCCQRILTSTGDVLAISDRVMSAPQGQVRLSVPKALGKFVIAPLMGPFLQRYPQVDVALQLTDTLLDLLASDLDMLIAIGDRPPGESGRPLTFVRQLLCATPQYLNRHGTPEQPEDLAQHDCIWLGETPEDNRWRFRQGEQRRQVEVQGRFVSNHSEARMAVVLDHLGITCLPHFTAAAALAEGMLVPVLPQWRYDGPYQGTAWVLYRPNPQLPPKMRVLIDYLAAALADNASSLSPAPSIS
ncbi:substrate binding domain-containing protein [Sodalis glossinidius]|uniref:substrate binding domain-containing protein n=1 Tax=Sodalis glossinidius TaxID=63612 RepID=UPI000318AB40|nr:substrate binding domain-containing protein [Sodalis glossinidius]